MAERIHPTAEEHEKAVRPIPRLGGTSAKVSFEDWDDYVTIMTSAVAEEQKAAITKALDDIAHPTKGGSHMVDLLLGIKRDELPTTDLFEGVSDADIMLHGRTHLHDPAQANLLAAMRSVKRGFTVVKGATGCGKTRLILDIISVFMAAKRRVLLMTETEDKAEKMANWLHKDLSVYCPSDFGLRLAHLVKTRPNGRDMAEVTVLIGTPITVNQHDMWKNFRPDVIFGEWGILNLHEITEPALLSTVANYMTNPESNKIAPFVQFGDLIDSTDSNDDDEPMGVNDTDKHNAASCDDGGNDDDYGDEESDDEAEGLGQSFKFVHPQVGLLFMQRMFLLDADAYVLDYQHRQHPELFDWLNQEYYGGKIKYWQPEAV